MNDSEAIEAILTAARYFNTLGIAYIHLAEADWDDAPIVTDSFRHTLRDLFDGAIIVAGNFTRESGEHLIRKGLVDFVAYGRAFITNPDLPRRFKESLPLSPLKTKVHCLAVLQPDILTIRYHLSEPLAATETVTLADYIFRMCCTS
ncbi:oxidoreductase [Aliamphritea spongicola]|nr:hypothetical protein [Aliamphritea spongicola]